MRAHSSSYTSPVKPVIRKRPSSAGWRRRMSRGGSGSCGSGTVFATSYRTSCRRVPQCIPHALRYLGRRHKMRSFVPPNSKSPLPPTLKSYGDSVTSLHGRQALVGNRVRRPPRRASRFSAHHAQRVHEAASKSSRTADCGKGRRGQCADFSSMRIALVGQELLDSPRSRPRLERSSRRKGQGLWTATARPSPGIKLILPI